MTLKKRKKKQEQSTQPLYLKHFCSWKHASDRGNKHLGKAGSLLEASTQCNRRTACNESQCPMIHAAPRARTVSGSVRMRHISGWRKRKKKENRICHLEKEKTSVKSWQEFKLNVLLKVGNPWCLSRYHLNLLAGSFSTKLFLNPIESSVDGSEADAELEMSQASSP